MPTPPTDALLYWLFLLAIAFLSGSIPFGLHIGQINGIDIRQHGSRNIGATNVGRVLGRKWGILCFALDMLKGFLPVLIGGQRLGLLQDWLLARSAPTTLWAWAWMGFVAAAILGHMFSPWVRFRGGKGVATGLGALLGVFPYLTIPAIGAFAIWYFVLRVWRYVSLASCAAAISLPILVLIWGAISAARSPKGGPYLTLPDGFWPYAAVTGFLALVVVYKHRTNIQRLIAGTESRVGRRVPVR